MNNRELWKNVLYALGCAMFVISMSVLVLLGLVKAPIATGLAILVIVVITFLIPFLDHHRILGGKHYGESNREAETSELKDSDGER